LTVDPEGIIAGEGQVGLTVAARNLASRLLVCAEKGESVLAGGHTGVWLSAIALLICDREPIPPIWTFDLERVRGKDEEAIFRPRQLCVLDQLERLREM
jgi:hypothetical protein